MENVKEKSMFDQWREHPCGLWVSREGEVFVPKSKKYPNGHLTYGSKNKNGYLQVKYKWKVYQVHRLVAEVFIPNPYGKETVDHINMVKTDNIVENLRWATRKEQQNFDDQTIAKKVIQLTIEGEPIREWTSTGECGRNGYKQSAVCNCCNGKRKTAYGFKWKYA